MLDNPNYRQPAAAAPQRHTVVLFRSATQSSCSRHRTSGHCRLLPSCPRRGVEWRKRPTSCDEAEEAFATSRTRGKRCPAGEASGKDDDDDVDVGNNGELPAETAADHRRNDADDSDSDSSYSDNDDDDDPADDSAPAARQQLVVLDAAIAIPGKGV